MKKNIILFLAVFLSSISLAQAENQVGSIYLNLDAGLSLSNNLKGTYRCDIGKSSIFAVGMKYRISPKVKLGADLAYRPGYRYHYMNPHNTDIKTTQRMKIGSLMVNATYDIFDFDNKITHYIEIGAGISRIGAGEYIMNSDIVGQLSSGKSKATYNFAANGGVGLSFALNNSTNLSYIYKYSYFGVAKTTTVDVLGTVKQNGKITANEFLISLSFRL